ncbi:MAG: SufE family protein [Pseudomonadota bacterium]
MRASKISIQEALDNLIDEFSFLETWEERYSYIIEMGNEIEPYPPDKQDNAHKIEGCISQVWYMSYQNEDGSLHMVADSDAFIVKGLIAILFRLYNDRMPHEITNFDHEVFFKRLGLEGYLSPNRRNGFVSIFQRIKQDGESML